MFPESREVRVPAITNRTAIKVLSSSHKFWYRMTGGSIGGRMNGMDVLLLTTTGRTSGKSRTAPLQYLADGDTFVVVASNGGSDRHPGWWLNLKSNPQAKVQARSRVHAVRAEEASADERERLWPRLNELYPDYQCYQDRTERRIPVVMLRPAVPQA
jgi:deazaflavin-dependent oxidoreductase (nitroreductase family)